MKEKRPVIDTIIDLGCEIDALDRCEGYKEMCWTGDSPESKYLLKGVREHFNAPWPEIAPLVLDTMIENMDAANVKYGVLHGMHMEPRAPWKTKKPWHPLKYVCPADYVKEVMDKYPGRFKGVAGIDPTLPRRVVLEQIELYVKEWGFSGIKLFPFQGWHTNDKELMYPIYEKCLDLDAVVCIISSQIGFVGARLSTAHPLQIDDIACDFPELKIQVVCGGERKVWHNEVVSICFHCPNVNMDTAPGMPHLWTGYARCQEDLRLVMEMIPDHIMWGSEYPYCFPMSSGIEALENIPWLTEEFRNKLFYENAAKFYGFE